jgi:hypothetical protein
VETEKPQGGQARRKGWLVGHSPVFLVMNSLLENGYIPYSSEVGTKSSQTFIKSSQNVTVLCGSDCLVVQDEFLLTIPLMIKKMTRMVLTLLSTCLAFLVSMTLKFSIGKTGGSCSGS